MHLSTGLGSFGVCAAQVRWTSSSAWVRSDLQGARGLATFDRLGFVRVPGSVEFDFGSGSFGCQSCESGPFARLGLVRNRKRRGLGSNRLEFVRVPTQPGSFAFEFGSGSLGFPAARVRLGSAALTTPQRRERVGHRPQHSVRRHASGRSAPLHQLPRTRTMAGNARAAIAPVGRRRTGRGTGNSFPRPATANRSDRAILRWTWWIPCWVGKQGFQREASDGSAQATA